MEEHPQARKIIDTLSKAGFIAYYAGGWVRDYLLQHPSDDIDIATNAPPETVQALFPRTVPIGIAFGIILVLIDDHEYEVATFRQDLDYKDGRRPSQVAFSSPEEDAKRRDFTINGMFYDPITEKVLDYVHGKEDLEKKIIRAIGNPHERIKEDRLRMVRAARLSCRFHFAIELETEKAILAHAKELFPAVAIERIVQEFTKAHKVRTLRKMLLELHRLHLLAPLFPELENVSISDVEERLLPTKKYPQKAPVIAFILPLFPNISLDHQQKLCKKLKLPNADLEFVTFLAHAKTLAEKEKKHPKSTENSDWAYVYANPLAEPILEILAAHELISIEDTEEKQKILAKAISRIQSKTPLINAETLINLGIPQGPALGKLLKQAERIAINEGLEDPSQVLKKLNLKP